MYILPTEISGSDSNHTKGSIKIKGKLKVYVDENDQVLAEVS